MTMLDQALTRLRQYAIDMDALVHQVSVEAPDLVDFAGRLARTSRSFAEDVETLHILALSRPISCDAVVAPPGDHSEPGATPPDAAARALDGEDMLRQSMAAHDRDFFQGRDGVPAHRAGERPDDCSACAVFAVLLQPEVSNR